MGKSRAIIYCEEETFRGKSFANRYPPSDSSQGLNDPTNSAQVKERQDSDYDSAFLRTREWREMSGDTGKKATTHEGVDYTQMS